MTEELRRSTDQGDQPKDKNLFTEFAKKFKQEALQKLQPRTVVDHPGTIVDLDEEGKITQAEQEILAHSALTPKAVFEKKEAELEDVREELKRVKSELYTDDLTGIENRKSFNMKFAEAVERARSSGEAFYFLQFDINYLKAANEQGGHPWGDELIKAAAQAAKGSMRGSDVIGLLEEEDSDGHTVARTGGDELEGMVYISSPEALQAWYDRAQEIFNSTMAEADIEGEHFSQALSLGIGAVRFDPKDYDGMPIKEVYKALKTKSEGPLEVAKKLAKTSEYGSVNALVTDEQVESNPDFKKLADKLKKDKEDRKNLSTDERQQERDIVTEVKESALDMNELKEALALYARLKGIQGESLDIEKIINQTIESQTPSSEPTDQA
jgi:diguanylate cyclase (GGDEF)-like protein